MSMIRLARILFLTTPIALALYGCTNTPKVQSEFGPASIAGFARTYDWMPFTNVSGDPELKSPQFIEFLRRTIENQIAGKGYIRKPGIDGFWLTCRIDTFQKSTKFLGSQDTYKEGSISLTAIDPKTKQFMWRGSFTAEIDPSDPPAEKRQKVQDAVNRILKEFSTPGKF